MTEHEPAACDFCDEFAGLQSLFHSLFCRYGISTRIIARSSHSVALAGLGALSPGYLLILPIRHAPALGYLTDEELADLIALKDQLGRQIQATFGARYGDTVFFEHGASSTRTRAGQSIDHAHLHALPGADIEFRRQLDKDFTPQLLTSLYELRAFSSQNKGYLFFEDSLGQKFAYEVNHEVISQYIRRLWADGLGYPHQYNWRDFPFEDNVLATLWGLGGIV